jgi:DNA-binding NarL/FixJ family response regulator
MPLINVSVVEDDVGTREALQAILDGTVGFRCVSVHGNGADALENLPVQQVDVVLMDLGLPEVSGIECTRQLKDRRPELLILVLTVHQSADKIFESLKAGATGYVLKKTAPAQIVEAIRDVANGGSPMSPAVARKVTQFFHKLPPAMDGLHRLTDREHEVLHEIAAGCRDKDIALKLALSTDTVRSHVRSILKKLQVNSRKEAAEHYLTR